MQCSRISVICAGVLLAVPMLADTAINLVGELKTVEGVYHVDGTVVTLVKENEKFNLSGDGTARKWSVVLDADAFLDLNAVKLAPASGAALDLNGHRADVTFTGASTLTGASGSAGLQVNEGSALTLCGYGDTPALTLQGNGGAASLGSAAYMNAGSITVNGGTVVANAPNLISNARRGAAIGGGYCGSGGTITINGGTVTAVGGAHAPGIGGGTVFESSVQSVGAGDITINGGTVTATGGKDGGPAIGVGHGQGTQATASQNGGTLTINGGTVTLNSGTGDTFSTVGGGKNTGASLDVVIDAAAVVTMNAQGANDHQFGNRYSAVGQGTLAFTNRRGLPNRAFLVLQGNDRTDYLAERAGYVTAALGPGFSPGDVSCVQYPGRLRYWATRAAAPAAPAGYDALIDLDDLPAGDHGAYNVLADGTVEIAAGAKVIVTGSGVAESSQDTTLKMLGAFDVTLSNAKIRGVTSGIDVNGQAGVLRLAEGTDNVIWAAYMSAYAAISLEDAASSLTLEGPGALTISANSTGAAGIGGGRGKSMLGTFVMNGGTLNVSGGFAVTSGQVAAMIGGGYCGSCGTVTINGGVLTATSTVYWGAAIGAGSTHGSTTAKVSAGLITINGGTVTVTGGEDGGPAIGSGHCNEGSDNFTGGTLVINGGTVNAQGGGGRNPGAGETAVFGGGKYATAGMDVTIDVAAEVTMNSRSDRTVAFGAVRATASAKGSLAITDRHGTAGFRRFLAYAVSCVAENPVEPTFAESLAGRVTTLLNVADAGGEARDYALDAPSGVELLYLTRPATNMTAFAVNGSVIELNGTKSVLAMGVTSGYTLKATGDFAPGAELILGDGAVNSAGSESSVPPLDLNGHSVVLRVADGCAFSMHDGGQHAGIRVDPAATLVIKGRGLADGRAESGRLTVTGRGKCAGIGGGRGERCGTVIMEGGDVTAAATGGSGTAGAGIGGGYGADGPVLFEMRDGWLQVGYYGNDSYQHGCGIGAGNSYNLPAGTELDAGHIVFKGGCTSVCGARDGGAAIGGGHSSAGNSSGGGVIEFLGGTVYAKGAQKDSDSAVIGGGKQGGYGPTVVLDVAATLVVQKGDTTSAWGIGGIGGIAAGREGSLTIVNHTGISESRVFFVSEFGDELAGSNGSGLAVSSSLAEGAAFSTTLSGATATSVFNPQSTTIDLASPGASAYFAVNGGVVAIAPAGAGKTFAVKGSGKSVKCECDCTLILSHADLTGLDAGANDVTIVLDGANTSTGTGGAAGVTVRDGGTVTIESAGDDSAGSLLAQGSMGGAGIGGDYNMGKAGNIVINGGTVTARGTNKAAGITGAGIGCGAWGSCGTITINGGVVTANLASGHHCAAIGGSANHQWTGIPSVGKITINGGTVTATSGNSGGAAIGSGHETAAGLTPAIEIEINGGTVTAKTGQGMDADFGAAVIGGGRKNENVRVTISTKATVSTSYSASGAGQSAYTDIGSPVPGVAGAVKIVAEPGTEGRVFLTTSYLDIFDTPQAALVADSAHKGDFLVLPNGSGRTYAYSPADLVWTGAGDGVRFSDARNWKGTLKVASGNGMVAFEAGGTLVNDVGWVSAARLRHAPGAGDVAITGLPLVSAGDMTLEGDGITLGETHVGGTLRCENGAQVRGGPVNVAKLALQGSGALPVADGARIVAESIDGYYAKAVYLDGMNGVVDFLTPAEIHVAGNSHANFSGSGQFRFWRGLDLTYATGSCNWGGSATYMLGGDVAGDMLFFHCIYGTAGTGCTWKPVANDVRVDDYVSLEGDMNIDTDDENGAARTFTLVRGLSSRNAESAGRVLTVRGSGALKVARAALQRGEATYLKAFNQKVNVTGTATFEFLPGASWDGSGTISVGAEATLALDAGAAPSVKAAEFASGSTVVVRGKVAKPNGQPYLTAASFSGRPKTIVVNGRPYAARTRDGGLYALAGGLTLIVR